jgi:hypothetical protein
VSWLLGATYAALWGLVVVETVALRKILREVVWLRRLQRAATDRAVRRVVGDHLPGGARAPRFKAPLAGTGRVFRTRDLEGSPSALLFLSVADSGSSLYDDLLPSILGVGRKTRGRLYIVCHGAEEDCRRMVDRSVGGRPVDAPILVDADGSITKSFRVTSTPTAVLLDARARVNRYGRMSLNHPLEDGASYRPGEV